MKKYSLQKRRLKNEQRNEDDPSIPACGGNGVNRLGCQAKLLLRFNLLL